MIEFRSGDIVGPVWDALERPAEPEPATQAEAHG
jgi:hypothetical protein